MIWLVLGIAIAIEVTATSLLKLAGQGSLSAIAAVVCGYALSFALVAQVVQRLEVGIVYAIWSGLGTALVAMIGIALYDESANLVKFLGLSLVIGGVAVLYLAGDNLTACASASRASSPRRLRIIVAIPPGDR